MRVLIIDDSRANRMVLQKFLKEFGFETAEAENGLDAIWMLKQRSDIDLITVDYHMPKMTGVQFVRLVREKPELDRVQIVMITSETSADRIADASEAGVNEFLFKPFDKKKLIEVLESLGIKPGSENAASGNATGKSPVEEEQKGVEGSAPAAASEPPVESAPASDARDGSGTASSP